MSDRLKAILDGLLRSVSRRIDYLAMYPAKVVSQNADGSLELRPDSDRLPGLSRVPIRYGMPGVRAEVPAGTRVLVGFEGGDPQRPIATLWEPGEANLLVVNAGTDFVALAQRVLDELNALRTTLNTHTHPVATTGTAAAQTGTAAATTSPAAPIGSVASETLKVK